MASDSCFLCYPSRELLYLADGSFFALLGLGPIVEGYTLIATREHIPSMLDLAATEFDSLLNFTQRVRETLSTYYGDVIVTEHGRIPICEARRGAQQHCFHAHRLVFPVTMHLDERLSGLGLPWARYGSPTDIRDFAWHGEYLYYENQEGECMISPAPSTLMPQFFRHTVAEMVGRPELASWAKYPQPDIILKARSKLRGIR